VRVQNNRRDELNSRCDMLVEIQRMLELRERVNTLQMCEGG
jgi:hypothetical protein